MSKPRYIAHTGGKQPVADDVMVEIIIRDGCSYDGSRAKLWGGGVRNWWTHEGARENHIIAYRVIK